MIEIVEIPAVATHPVRRSVLRTGTVSDDVVFDGDDESTTFHLGVTVHGELVAVSTWRHERCAHHPGRPAYRLRGMATLPAQRTSGFGGRLLDAGIDRCRTAGAELVWARARVSALDFYVHRGFEPIGGHYLDATTGLPHCDIVLELSG
jgi:predicted GNAT family N-acyltransferase